LAALKAKWDAQNPGTSWWALHRTYIITSAIYLNNSLDESINLIEQILPNAIGADKKAAVMAVMGKIFDYIVVQAFPFWLVPFAPTIKDVIINVLIGSLIDFIVAKYNAGSWTVAANGQTPTQP
jgi:hypothetical protein